MSETGSIAKPPPAAAYGRDATAPDAPEARPATPPAEPEQPHADPAIRLASRLANLVIGQAILGEVLRQQEEGRPLLRTPSGDFAVDPVRALPARGSVEILLTRVTPSVDGSDLTGLLVARDGQPLDPPQTVRLTLVRLPQATPQPAPGVSPPAAPLLRIALDTLPEAAKAALAIPTELAGTALLAPTQGALRAGLIPPGAPTLPNPGAPTLPTPGAPTLAAALPPASQPRPSPVLQALRPAAPPLPGGPATSVPPLPEAGSRIVHAPVPEYPRQPAPQPTEHRAAQASQPAAVPPPQAEAAPKTVPPSAPLAPNPPRQNPAPAATGLLPAPGPAPAAYAVASPASAAIAPPASAFSPDPWLKAPTLILATAEGRPVGHVSVVAAEPAAAHSLLRAPTPDSPLGRLVKAGRLLIAETRAEGAAQDAARLQAPAHAATQPARGDAAPVATLRIVAGGQEYVLVSPPDLPADAPPARLLLLHTGPADTAAPAPPPQAIVPPSPDGVARTPVAATVAFLFKALSRQGFQIEALEPVSRAPDLSPLARLAGVDAPAAEAPRLLIVLQPPTPQAPPIQAVLWFQPPLPRDDNQDDGQDGAESGAAFHVDITFPGLGESRLSGALRPQGLDMRFASRNPVSPALQASTRAAFEAALGDRPGRLWFLTLPG